VLAQFFIPLILFVMLSVFLFCQPSCVFPLNTQSDKKENVSKHDKQKTPKLFFGNRKEPGRFKVLEAALFSRGLGTY
jgi:hypothetical protein